MKITIIDNVSVTCKDNRYYTNALNGLFIDELTKLGNQLNYFQFKSLQSNNISSFDLQAHGVNCILPPLKKNKYFSYMIAYLVAIRVIKKSDFVYLYYPNSYRYIVFLCMLLKRPYGLYIRGMNGLNDNLSHYIYRHAYTIFTVSDFFTNMVNEVTNSKIAHTIRPMIPYTDKDVVVNRNYQQKEEYNILFLGRIARDKGLEELMNATKRLRERGYRFSLQIVGNGEYSEELLQLISQLDIGDVVSYEGPIFDNEKKATYYKRADIYVLPTYHEGFPRTLYEAMIFGTPIVTTFVGGIPALMQDGENSRRIEPKSVDSIVDGLSYAMDNYEEMGKMAKNGSELVSRIVDRNRMSHARQLYQIIQDYGK